MDPNDYTRFPVPSPYSPYDCEILAFYDELESADEITEWHRDNYDSDRRQAAIEQAGDRACDRLRGT